MGRNTGRLRSQIEGIALCGTRCVIFDIQAWSFTSVNSLRLQSQCLAITAFCKAPQKQVKGVANYLATPFIIQHILRL